MNELLSPGHYHQRSTSLRIREGAFIGGQFVPAKSGKTFASRNPADGSIIAHVAECAEEDVDSAVQTARKAFEQGYWSNASPLNRKKVLLRLADLVEQNLEELAVLESIDSGKPITDALSCDIPESATCIRWYAELCDKLYDQVAPTASDITAMIVREPIGVVGAVTPWNFPLMMAVWKVAPAMAGGNSVVLKPAELTPLTALRFAELCSEAGLPEGVFNVVPGMGETAGQAVGRHQLIDCVAFTGSTDVGRQFLRYSAESNMKRVHLECGGKSPCVVMRDASNLDAVAASVAGSILWMQGENCIASSRLIVDRSIKNQLLEKILIEIAKYTIGDPLDPRTRLGPMIESQHLKRVLDYMLSGVEDGAQVALKGKQTLQETGGSFVTPTVFDEVSNSMRIAQEEIFGPVLSIIPFDSVEQAVSIANDTQFGLAACLWTSNLDTAHRIARLIRAGTIAVNCYSEGDMTVPFGGYKLSGFGGRDKAIMGHDIYTETKTIWIKHAA